MQYFLKLVLICIEQQQQQQQLTTSNLSSSEIYLYFMRSLVAANFSLSIACLQFRKHECDRRASACGMCVCDGVRMPIII
jgi:hypothetical protein